MLSPSPPSMTVRLYTEKDRHVWDKYVLQNAGSTCYHQAGWKEVIEKSFRHPTFYLLSENSERAVNGILPLVQLKSALFGNFLVSLPYFNYGGICADDPDVEDRLLREAIRIGLDGNAEYIELRHVREINCLRAKTAKVSMHRSLSGSAEELWKSFPAKLRSQVQRPIKERMFVRFGGEELLDDFYSVFSANMRDLGTPVYAKDFFRNILAGFPTSTWICTISTRDKLPVASGFLVGFKKALEIPWASSLRRYNRYSPNMLLYWSVLEFACKAGYQVFDFGRSTVGEGTYRFKEQWGAEPVQLYWHYWMRNGSPLPQLNPGNPKYRLAITIWKRLPLSLTNLIGPAIVKNLP